MIELSLNIDSEAMHVLAVAFLVATVVSFALGVYMYQQTKER